MGFDWGTFADVAAPIAMGPLGFAVPAIRRMTQSGGVLNPAQAAMPDYNAAAERQAGSSAANVGAQTQANRPGQTNAFGSSVGWSQGPDGQWHQSQSFGGPWGGLSSNLMGQAAQQMGSPMDWGQFGAMKDGSAARDQAITASYDQATSRLNPQWAAREEASGAQLANQGLDPNSQAYRNAMRQQGQQRNDAYGSAMNAAIGQGNEAGQQVFNQNMMARQQSIAEALQRRNQPLQSLMGMQGFLQQPGFSQAGQADPTQYLPAAMAAGNFGMQNAQMQNQAGADFWSGLTGLAGAAAGGVGMAMGKK